MKLMKRFAVMVAHLGLDSKHAVCPLYATEHPVARGVNLSAQMLEARVGR